MAKDSENLAVADMPTSNAHGKIELKTIQWQELPDINDVEQISSKDYAVLEELRTVLVRHGYTDRFGVTLLHKHFDLNDDEVLMERTDEVARVSTLSVETRKNSSKTTIETMWKFGNTIVGATVCKQMCDYNKGHKLVHKKVGV